jgi:predicted NAD/FAD-binding protein
MRIAVVGGGIAGLTAARLLSAAHEVTVFEAESWLGGHTHTHQLIVDGEQVTVDTGFIVFNDRAYPHFVSILNRLGVESRPTSMSFSVRDDRGNLEYGGESLRSVFAQRSNLLRPSFWRLLRDILRFGREHQELLEPGDEALGLTTYLRHRRYSDEFIEQYARPIGAAIWSAPPASLDRFPARHFVRFFAHHGVLDVRHPPQWRTIVGGSARYVAALTAPLRPRLITSTPVGRVMRRADHVAVVTAAGDEARFDRVVIAAHSDQALAMLDSPTEQELQILGSIPYQANQVTLHCDTAVMPRRRAAWSSWNSWMPPNSGERVIVTYWMNLLQGLTCKRALLVSLNAAERIDPQTVLATMNYHHPVYTRSTLDAQARWNEIDGRDRVHYCGAYWGYGFHEDGVDSALAVTARFGIGLEALRGQAT